MTPIQKAKEIFDAGNLYGGSDKNFTRWLATPQAVALLSGEDWISVKDRLPDYDVQVICYNIHGKTPRVMTGWRFKLMPQERRDYIDDGVGVNSHWLGQGGDYWGFPYICHPKYITHWQHLPEPPKPLEP